MLHRELSSPNKDLNIAALCFLGLALVVCFLRVREVEGFCYLSCLLALIAIVLAGMNFEKKEDSLSIDAMACVVAVQC